MDSTTSGIDEKESGKIVHSPGSVCKTRIEHQIEWGQDDQ